MTDKIDLNYKETTDALVSRISVHKKFSQFEINDWILETLKISPGEHILDIGCGDGKQALAYAGLVGESGLVIGADKDSELLKKAQDASKDYNNLSFEPQNLNDRFKWDDDAFDAVSCCFAIYYAADAEKTVLEMKRVLKNGGRLFICGPSANNALELNQIHEKITGRRLPPTAIIRAGRIKSEILPLIAKNFHQTTVDLFKNKISFPDASSFMNYYSSTLLFKESVPDEEKADVLDRMTQEVQRIIAAEKAWTLNKEVIGILAYK